MSPRNEARKVKRFQISVQMAITEKQQRKQREHDRSSMPVTIQQVQNRHKNAGDKDYHSEWPPKDNKMNLADIIPKQVQDWIDRKK